MQIWCAASQAADSQLVAIESAFMKGFSGIQLVGQAAEVCKNGLERAKAVLESCDVAIPARRIILNLAPAEGKKDGSQFDLAFAVSLLCLTCETPPKISPTNWLFVAELGLDGELRPVQGAAAFAIASLGTHIQGIVVATENEKEVQAICQNQVNGPMVLAFSHFSHVMLWLLAAQHPNPTLLTEWASPRVKTKGKPPTFDDMHLTLELQQIALVTATGRHNLLLWGSPGTGKSMFSARLPSLLPPLSSPELWESLRTHSLLTTHVAEERIRGEAPFRNPHHQASATAILGSCERPGELALAHGGILFLDELPEFRRDILEGLREPLETGWVHVSRAQHKMAWRAKVTLVAACNNCPCGWHGSRRKRCICPIPKIQGYRRRLSGPILERIDLHLNMEEPQLASSELFLPSSRRDQTKRLAAQVQKAIEFGRKRNEALGIRYNCELQSDQILVASGHSASGFSQLASEGFSLSASPRSLIRAFRVARTLADLEAHETISSAHIAKALDWQAEAAAKHRGDATLGLSS